MKKYLIYTLICIILFTACNTPEKEIEVHNAWVRPTAQGENAAVYFTMHNHTDEGDELLGVSSNVADAIEIHKSKIENDIMQMDMLTSLPLAADEEVIFKPGGLHIMLVKIKQELVLGEHIGLILHFKSHEDIVVNVIIDDEMPSEDMDH